LIASTGSIDLKL